jgi:hypothetical protein
MVVCLNVHFSTGAYNFFFNQLIGLNLSMTFLSLSCPKSTWSPGAAHRYIDCTVILIVVKAIILFKGMIANYDVRNKVCSLVLHDPFPFWSMYFDLSLLLLTKILNFVFQSNTRLSKVVLLYGSLMTALVNWDSH